MPFEGHDLWPTVWPTSIRKNDIDTNNFGWYRTNPYEITFIFHTHIPKLKWMFTLVSMTFDLRFDLYIWAEIAWTLTISFSDDISETYGEVTFILQFWGERSLSRLPYVFFCYTPPDKVGVGGGVMASPRMSSRPARRPSVRISFPKENSKTHGWISLIMHTHKGVDVPFGVFEIWPSKNTYCQLYSIHFWNQCKIMHKKIGALKIRKCVIKCMKINLHICLPYMEKCVGLLSNIDII